MPSFDRWAAEYGLSPSLLKALAWMESGWQAGVISPSGAIGIGQLLPDTAAFVAGTLIGVPLDPYVADDNIRMSARFLAYLLNLTNGDVNMALAGLLPGSHLGAAGRHEGHDCGVRERDPGAPGSVLRKFTGGGWKSASRCV